MFDFNPVQILASVPAIIIIFLSMAMQRLRWQHGLEIQHHGWRDGLHCLPLHILI